MTRCRTDGRGGTGLPETMSAIAISTGGPASGATTHRRRAHDVHTPSTSVIAGPPHGPVSPRQHPADHDALADDVRAEQVRWSHRAGVGADRHVGILGCAHESATLYVLQEEPVTYVIAQPCVDLKDRACVDECPVDCIYEGKRMLYIHPDECVDCGACEPVCPVEAIFYEDDTPEQWKDYYAANVDFFDDLGSPGGAAKMGVIDKDHPLIAALPPQNQE